MRRWLAALWLLAAPALAEPVTLTIPQARNVAQAAFMAGDMAAANALARKLQLADPADPLALLLLAATEPELGNPGAGRRAGRQAWTLTDDPALRYEVARYTARAALLEGRPMVAQYWLRRASDMAPTEGQYDRTAADFRELRNRTPLTIQLDMSVAPTSNLNNGADGGLLVIQGVPPIGTLSGSAQALSGVRGNVEVRLGYRLDPRPRSRSELGLRLYTTVNRLSDSAAAKAPDVTGSDFNQIVIEASLRHDVLPDGWRTPLGFDLAAGHSWYGGEATGPNLRVGVDKVVQASDSGITTLSLSGERQWEDGGRLDAVALGIDGARKLGDDRLTWALILRKAEGDAVNQDNHSLAGSFGYALGGPLGGVLLGGRLTAGYKDYDRYQLGFIGVRDGRQDRSIGLSIDITAQKLAFMGYAPRLSLTAGRTWSNISRFDTQTFGVQIGLRSSF